jgi:Fic family protein
MFEAQYSISDQLLANITRVNSLVRDLNDRRFPKVVLYELTQAARAVSSHASTSIEGNPLPLTEVKKILKTAPVHARDSEREVLNYNQALELLDQKLHADRGEQFEISLQLILDVQRQVTDGLLPKFESGHLRKKPVVVNDPRTGQVVYLPPDAQEVESLLTDLLVFIKHNHSVINPLILAGIFHKQMVIIHPFMDGNGRTARLLTKVLLAKMGLNTFNLFSFENYYNQNVSKYFQVVGEYGDYLELRGQIDFSSWLEYFTAGLIDELLRVSKLLPKLSLTPATHLEKHHLKMMEETAAVGYMTDRDYAKLTKRAKATRTLDFQRLLDLGLIERKGKGKATYYVLSEL